MTSRVETEIRESMERFEEVTGLYPDYIVLGERRYKALCDALQPRAPRPNWRPQQYRGARLVVVPAEMLDCSARADFLELS